MHLLQLLQSGGCWKEPHFREALKHYSCFAFVHKINWTSIIPRKGFLDCSLLCNLWSAESVSWFHMIVCLYPYVISKTGHVASVLETKLAQRSVWLVISTGSFENEFEALSIQTLPIVQHWVMQEPGSDFWGLLCLQNWKGEQLPRLYFKVTFLQHVINEGFELVIGIISLCCKWL